ncbi:MAG: cell division protein FtsA [Firmicutes bacterium]|nr:cell division protein FtsA [Bacillota bacterium]
MAKRDTLAVLDLGSSQIRIVVGEMGRNEGIDILGIGAVPSEGLRKGAIVDMEAAAQAVGRAAEQAHRMSGVPVREVGLATAAGHLSLLRNRGVVGVSRQDREINAADVERVLQAARVVTVPPDRELIDMIPRHYIVDGFDGIRDPVGMAGMRLEVDTMMITAAAAPIQNLVRCVERSGLTVKEFVVTSFALGEQLLTRDEKELGAVLVDLGGGTTDLAVFHQGGLYALSSLPIGGEYITSDIAVGLRTSLATAERVKVEHGRADAASTSEEKTFEVRSVAGEDSYLVSERVLAGIIEPRVQEIFSLVREELERLGAAGFVPCGMVLTGGVSLTPGIVTVAQEETGWPARVARPDFVGVDNPLHSGALAVAVFSASRKVGLVFREQPRRNLIRSVRSWFKEFVE